MPGHSNQAAKPWPNVTGDRLVRMGNIVGYREGNEGLEYRIQSSSGCHGCSRSCGWRKGDFWLSSTLGVDPNRERQASAVHFAVSRRGLSLASGLIFGVPLITFVAAAVLFDGRLGDSLVGLTSVAVFAVSLSVVGVLGRSRLLSFDRWLRFEWTDFSD